MLGKILSLFASVILLVGCSSNAPDIRAICLLDDIGNYVIKWETDPVMEGIVKMTVSDNPDLFTNESPIIYANIKDGVATYITNDNISRKYFRLSFNDKYPRIIGARSAVMDSVQNFRDLGGYTSTNGKTVKWGKVFRSGELSSLSEWDSIRLDNLGIKTIIDLRTNQETLTAPIKYTKANILQIPISVGKIADAPQRVIEGRMRKGDAGVYMEDEYLQFVTDNTDQFAKVLEQFQNEDNYPILISCSYGKDRTGFLTAMLLAALDIPRDAIMEDYLTSNQYIDTSHLADIVKHLSTDAQESITVFLTANEGLMDLAFHKIKKEYGSTEKYLSKGLRLTDKKRERLKDILLY